MDQKAITLKNLYRLLTINDYLLFSHGVLQDRDRLGMTLTSFWRDILLPEWQSGMFGAELWQKERSRYLSDFCNRKDSVPFYEEYAEEIFQALNRDLMREQTESVLDYLTARHYNAELLGRKIECLLKAQTEEDFLSQADCRYLLTFIGGKNGEGQAEFYDAWLFAVLSLCAMCGKALYAARLVRIIRNEDLTPAFLEGNARQTNTQKLQLKARSIYGAAEDPLTFFGRQKELYDLTEAVRGGRKLFICGIGGIGKTELLRQLLVYLQKQENSLNLIPARYQEELPKSLMQCFEDVSSYELREGFFECVRRIRSLHGPALLLLDNAEVRPQEEEYWRALAALPCAVVVTSRGKAPEGFEEMPLGSLSDEAALLMLRRHYERKLSREEQQRLKGLIRSNLVLKHPLTIRLIALSARRSGWTGTKLTEMLETHVETSYALLPPQLRMIYKKLYAAEKLGEEEQRLLRMLAFLPYRQYTAERLQMLCLRKHTATETEEVLAELARKGWIEKKDDAYSLHPLIAECLSEGGFTEAQLADFFAYAQEIMGQYLIDYMMFDEKYEACRLLLKLTEQIRGELSPASLRLFCLASLTEQNLDSLPQRYERISSLLASAREKTAETDLLAALIDAHYGKTLSEGELLQRFKSFLARNEADRRTKLSYGNLLLHYYLYFSARPDDILPIAALCEELTGNAEERFCLRFIRYVQAERSYHTAEADEAFAALEAELELVRGEKEERRAQTLMQTACVQRALYKLFAGQTELSEALFRQRQSYPKAADSTNYRQQELSYRAHLARIRKNYDEAVSLFEELIDSHRRFDGENDINVRIQEVELAKVYKESGQPQKALSLYQTAISAVERDYPNYGALYAMHCQLAAVYLELRRPQEAAALLKADAERISDKGGAVYAEQCYLLSRACRQQEDAAAELAWLLRSDPLMKICYPEDHPKRVYVRERLTAIKTIEEE